MAQRCDWFKGDIKSLLLYLIFHHPMYGYQIIKELKGRSKGYFEFKEGTLYPVLHRLERAGLIRGQWETIPSGRQRKYYYITEKGRVAVSERRSQWRDFVTAMDLIIRPIST